MSVGIKVLKYSAILSALIALITIVAGCNQQSIPTTTEDVLTQKTEAKDKIKVTVLVKYAFSADTFEKIVEEKFPNLDLIQVGNYTDNSSNELEQRMCNDDLTDIIFTWPLNIGNQYFEERLLDLSGMSFTGKYNISMLDKLSSDGKLYYLPGPAQVRGIVYNKTMFKENGWEVPKDYEAFLALCEDIEAIGIRPLQLSLAEPEVIETAFWGFGYNEALSRPHDSQKLVGFNDGKESFGNFTENAFKSFERLIDDGVIKPEDLNVRFYQRTDSLFSRQCAMISDSAELTHLGMEWANCPDEFAVMPFYSPGETGDWAQIYLTCHIGLNKHLAEPQNKEKYDLVMQIMDYISTEEGQKALAGDDGGMISNVIGVPIPNIPEIFDMKSTLEQGRFAPFPNLINAQNALHEGLSQMLEGHITSDEVIKMVDTQNKKPLVKDSSFVIGNASETFSLIETGNFVTDAMRKKSGADFALFLDNGKDGKFNARGISAKIYQGDITEDDIKLRVLPVLQHNEKGVLQVVSMSGEDIVSALEHTLDDGNWFYYFSGLKMSYAPTGEPGTRIKSITDLEDKELEPSRIYNVAIMDGSVEGKYTKSTEDLNISIYDVVYQAIKDAKTISPSKDGRFVISEA